MLDRATFQAALRPLAVIAGVGAQHDRSDVSPTHSMERGVPAESRIVRGAR